MSVDDIVYLGDAQMEKEESLVTLILPATPNRQYKVPTRLVRDIGFIAQMLPFRCNSSTAAPTLRLPDLPESHLLMMVKFEEHKEEHLAAGQDLKSFAKPIGGDLVRLEKLLDDFVLEWVAELSWPHLLQLLTAANSLRHRDLVTSLGCRLAALLQNSSAEELMNCLDLNDEHNHVADVFALTEGARWAYDEQTRQ